MSRLAPVPPRERLLALDVLRGFALCGVLIGNMVLYSGRWTTLQNVPRGTVLDRLAELFLIIFVDSKAQTLLTLLFGLGFAMQLTRAGEREEPVMGLYVRRLVALLGFGALHVILLWWGDVVWTYAISGFGLLVFLRVSNRTRILVAIGLTVLPRLVLVMPGMAEASIGVFMEQSEFVAHTARMGEVLHRGDHAGLPWQHLEYALVWSTQLYSWYFFWTLGRFLLGYVAGKLRLFDDDGAAHLGLFRKFVLWGFPVAAVTHTIIVTRWLGVLSLRDLGLAGRVVTVLAWESGLIALTLAYVGLTVLLLQRQRWRRILAVLGPPGRMPLTIYFSQSVIATFLFYGWGLGWAGRIDTARCIGLAVAIFSVQVAISHLWLRYFRFGPLEWLWRVVVYLKWPAMRVT